MLREQFLGRNPSHFQLNPLVKAYIISESFMWSAWNFVIPIFAVFIVQDIKGASVQTAAAGYSTYLISRVGFELLCGRMLAYTTDRKKATMAIIGMSFVAISYLGFAFTHHIEPLFIFYFLSGVGIGLESPAKNALFSIHLDKKKEATEWSISDAFQFFSMALATTIGGVIAFRFGFQILFFMAFIFNCIAILPYLLFLRQSRKES